MNLIFNCFKNILLDLRALKTKYKVSYIKSILSNRGFHALLFYRISNCFYKLKIPIIPLVLTRLIQILYCIDIDYRAEIDGGIILIHGTGIVIGRGVKIKSGCIIYHGVTLGIKGSGLLDGFPSIEKNVILGSGCKILGKVKIGENSIIGTNVVVTFNVPSNSIVKFSKHSFIIKTKNESSLSS